MLVIGLALSACLVLPGLSVLEIAGVKVRNSIERIILSYTLSLAMVLGLLYLAGIANAFYIGSFLVLGLVMGCAIALVGLLATKAWRSRQQLKGLILSQMSMEKLVLAILSVGLLSVYVAWLPSRAILDSDVVEYYLPMAREIVRTGGFTYGTGFDYNILLKPIAASTLYAWVYQISGSYISEAFRLMPLIPVLILPALGYAIAAKATKSKTVGLVSGAIFLVLPFQDRFLLYNALYPDVFYYPLALAAIYLLLEYSQTRRGATLFWIGLALGVASLLKAQTVYLLFALLLVLALLTTQNRKLSFALCCLAPLLILVPNFLAESIVREGLVLSIPVLSPLQVGLFIFLIVVAGIFSLLVVRKASPSGGSWRLVNWASIRKVILLLAPFAFMSSLWYLNNLLRFGTLLYTSSVGLPNFDWAVNVLDSIAPASGTASVWQYLAYFFFMFIDSSVMGYIWLIPLCVGLVYALKARLENLNVLILFEAVLAIIIFSQLVYDIPQVGVSTLNPRDLYVLVAGLTTVSSIGIVSMSSAPRRVGTWTGRSVTPLLVVAYFGLLSYIHSVFVWFVSSGSSTGIRLFASNLVSIFGLTLNQTSLQLYAEARVTFISGHFVEVFALSFFASLPLLGLAISRRLTSSPTGHRLTATVRARFRATAFRLRLSFRSERRKVVLKTAIAICLIGSVILIPRAEMFHSVAVGTAWANGNGQYQGVAEQELHYYYGPLYELIADGGQSLEGGIVTYQALPGLAYYMIGIKVIDLTYAANLGFLKEYLTSSSPYDAVTGLRAQGIRYLLFNPATIQTLDAALNHTLSSIMGNPELAVERQQFGSWKLYALGPYTAVVASVLTSSSNVDVSLAVPLLFSCRG